MCRDGKQLPIVGAMAKFALPCLKKRMLPPAASQQRSEPVDKIYEGYSLLFLSCGAGWKGWQKDTLILQCTWFPVPSFSGLTFFFVSLLGRWESKVFLWKSRGNLASPTWCRLIVIVGRSFFFFLLPCSWNETLIFARKTEKKLQAKLSLHDALFYKRTISLQFPFKNALHLRFVGLQVYRVGISQGSDYYLNQIILNFLPLSYRTNGSL